MLEFALNDRVQPIPTQIGAFVFRLNELLYRLYFITRFATRDNLFLNSLPSVWRLQAFFIVQVLLEFSLYNTLATLEAQKLCRFDVIKISSI